MYKHIFLLCLLVSVCLAQDDDPHGAARKRIRHKYHKHHLLHNSGILYYLAFLAVKVKVVFLIASMISFWLFAGKLFGILKYGFSEFKKSEPEKVFLQSPHSSYYPSTPEFYDHEHDHGDTKYGRGLEGGIHDGVELLKNVLQSFRFDINDYVFESMKIGTESCRKKFVCEAEYRAKENSLLALGMYMIDDNSLEKYKTNATVAEFEDCSKLYPDCLREATVASAM